MSSQTASAPDDSGTATLLGIIDEILATGARGHPQDLDTHLVHLDARTLPSTKATARCHFLQLDGNNRPKVDALVRFLVNLVIDYSIPRNEIDEALEEAKDTGSTQKISELKTKAKNLFTDLEKSGEGGELLLYVLVERFLKIPQLICKMSLKTNGNVHYHGVDGIHAKVDTKNKKLALYWGESKLYKKIGDAIADCFGSLEKFLNYTGSATGSADRDIALIRGHVDLGDDDAQKAILAFLDPNSIHSNSVEYRGVCLIGFDYDGYPGPKKMITIQELKSAVEKAAKDWCEKIGTQILGPKKLSQFEIEVFLLPFPSVEKFRAAFSKALSKS